MPILSKSGYRYVVTFIIMKSRCAKIDPLRRKSKFIEVFNQYCRVVKVGCGIDVKALRSDNGGEYRKEAMNNSANIN